MPQNARVVVLMEDDEKTELKARARAANKSLGEYMRDRSLGEEDETLDELVALLRQSTAKANAALDRALASIEAALQGQSEREARARAAALEEFAGLDPAGLAAVLGGAAPAARTAAPRGAR